MESGEIQDPRVAEGEIWGVLQRRFLHRAIRKIYPITQLAACSLGIDSSKNTLDLQEEAERIGTPL